MKKKLTPEQILDFRTGLEKQRKLIMKAQYSKAFVLARSLYRKDPSNPLKKMRYAILLGDNQKGLTPKQIEKNHKKSAKILKSIVENHLYRIPKEFQNSLLNEYFWFSKLYKKQYQLGIARAKSGDKRGYYSQGVGSSMLALALLLSGKQKPAEKWAKLSIESWKEYFKFRPDYYNSYCFFARALGANGDFKKMEEALLTAAKLANRSPNFAEFCEVRADVWRAHYMNSRQIEVS